MILKGITRALRAPESWRRWRLTLLQGSIRQEFTDYLEECRRQIAMRENKDEIDRDVRALAQLMNERQELIQTTAASSPTMPHSDEARQ